MSELGLFPLGIVLLPTEQVPLHIFEERYKELIAECLDSDQEFGLVYADGDGVRDVGTRAAVIEVLAQLEDGRMNIVVEGRDRFRLLELTEGRNRQVRKMTAAVGHPTLRLIRVRIGHFGLGDIPPGEWRELGLRERALVLRRASRLA